MRDRVLVTGGAGFIGSNIVEALIRKHFYVRVLDNLSSGKKTNLEDFVGLSYFDFVEGDIRNIEICNEVCNGIDYVIHQAAAISVPESIKDPLYYNDINVTGTINIMKAAIDSGVKRFVFASSSAVYGDDQNYQKIENHTGKLLSPYALSKRINEEYAELLFNIYGLKTIGLRYFNVFGRKQDPNSPYAAAIPLFINKLLSHESPVIYGDGLQTRDFIYVEDVAEANILACFAKDEAYGQVFNVGHGQNTTIIELLEKINFFFGSKINPIHIDERPGDIKYSLADISKAKDLLSFNPKFDLDAGLKKTIEWFQENRRL